MREKAWWSRLRLRSMYACMAMGSISKSAGQLKPRCSCMRDRSRSVARLGEHEARRCVVQCHMAMQTAGSGCADMSDTAPSCGECHWCGCAVDRPVERAVEAAASANSVFSGIRMCWFWLRVARVEPACRECRKASSECVGHGVEERIETGLDEGLRFPDSLVRSIRASSLVPKVERTRSSPVANNIQRWKRRVPHGEVLRLGPSDFGQKDGQGNCTRIWFAWKRVGKFE